MKVVAFLNLTPHEITIFNGDNVIRVPSHGSFRLNERVKPSELESVCEIVYKEFTTPKIQVNEVGDLPENGYIGVIVSQVVANYFELCDLSQQTTVLNDLSGQVGIPHSRFVFLYPDTGPESVVRDESGRIIGVKRLVAIA